MSSFTTAQEAAKALPGKVERLYQYTDDFVVARLEPKSFRPISKNRHGWELKFPEGKRPLYGADKLPSDTIIVCEGEKACDAARKLGFSATTSSGGASSPRCSDWLPLSGKRQVFIFPDNDEAGQKYAESVATLLAALPMPPTIYIVNLPDLPPKGDLADYIEARDSRTTAEIRGEILDFVATVAPWKPSGESSADAVPPKESGAKASTCPTPNVLMAGAISTKPIHWLWENRLERGAFNLLAGDPGCGKSLLAAALAATVTTGARWPDATHDFGRPAQNVLIVASEDDPAKSTVPRLTAAGADLDRVAILRTVIEDDHERQLCLQRDLRAIEQAVEQVGSVALVIIDPLDSYLGKADSNANEQVRQVLEPLVGLAERLDICVLGIKHLNKAIKTTPTALYRIGGSIAFVALPRTAHILGKDPDDKRRKLFAPVKVSHGRTPDALAYAVEVNDAGLPVIAWEAEAVEVDPDDVVAGTKGRTATAKDRAVEWLMAELSVGPVPSKDIAGKAAAVGIPVRTLARAKEDLGVVALQKRDGDRVVGWMVSLPAGGETP